MERANLIDAKEGEDPITIAVSVIPRSSRTAIVGLQDGVLKIKLKSPPVDGAANEELIRFLAKELRIPRSSVEIVSGQTSRTKRLRITGVTITRIADLAAKKAA